MDSDRARLHNLLLRVYKAASKKKIDITQSLKEDYLVSKLYFRKDDFRIINKQNPYFHKVKDGYELTQNAKDKVNKYIINHTQNEGASSLKQQYIELFEQLDKEFKQTHDISDEKANHLIEIAPSLHWWSQPEYEEYMLVNSGLIPEDDLTLYYNHYHRLEDLYWVLSNNQKKKKIRTSRGDKNLDIPFEFEVYSNRWGHHDTYNITRTLEGWNVSFLSTGGKGDKEGSAIIFCMDHDSISYPHNVSSFFRDIWTYADENTVSVEKIRSYMQRVADWISLTESKRPKVARVIL
jgi:hypothetical protein